MGNVIDVSKRYSREIQDINNKLMELEKGHIYENTGATQHGYLAHNISQLREMFDELIFKIENDEESTNERLRKALNKTNI